jgi:hypothetical protein
VLRKRSLRYWIGTGGCVVVVALLISWTLRSGTDTKESKARNIAALALGILVAVYLYAHTVLPSHLTSNSSDDDTPDYCEPKRCPSPNLSFETAKLSTRYAIKRSKQSKKLSWSHEDTDCTTPLLLFVRLLTGIDHPLSHRYLVWNNLQHYATALISAQPSQQQ